jgi:hypothetical protein
MHCVDYSYSLSKCKKGFFIRLKIAAVCQLRLKIMCALAYVLSKRQDEKRRLSFNRGLDESGRNGSAPETQKEAITILLLAQSNFQSAHC